MTSTQDHPSGIIRVGPFAGFYQRFEDLIASSTHMGLYFIHSRRWRENSTSQRTASVRARGGGTSTGTW